MVLAGGMESMSNAPICWPRRAPAFGWATAKSKTICFLTAWKTPTKRRADGVFAEQCAEHYGFTRAMQDEFAIRSLTRAQDAIRAGRFASEITPVTLQGRKGEEVVSDDEQPLKANLDKIPSSSRRSRKTAR